MTYSGGQSVDRRAGTRRNVRIVVNIDLPDRSPAISGRIQDISAGGMKVKAETIPVPFKTNDKVWFSVSREYLNFEGEGKILWTARSDDAIGIKFVQLNKKSRKSLEDFLSLFIDPCQ